MGNRVGTKFGCPFDLEIFHIKARFSGHSLVLNYTAKSPIHDVPVSLDFLMYSRVTR